MRVVMPAIIDQTGRQFNVDEADGVNRRHRMTRAGRVGRRESEGERPAELLVDIITVGGQGSGAETPCAPPPTKLGRGPASPAPAGGPQ